MAATFAYLRNLRLYKTGWRIQVKILHTWKQYTAKSGETFEMVLADERGTKIHATVKKDIINRYENQLPLGEWRFIETFSVTQACGQYRPTNHVYKIGFLNQTSVIRCESKLDSSYLTLAKFSQILSGNLRQYHLIDALGQIVNIGELVDIETNNKSKKKLEIELRDERLLLQIKSLTNI